MFMNDVVIAGELRDTPELIKAENGTPITKFIICVRRKDNGKDFETHIPCLAVGNKATQICKTLLANDLIIVQGSLSCKQYFDNKGIERFNITVCVRRFSFDEAILDDNDYNEDADK